MLTFLEWKLMKRNHQLFCWCFWELLLFFWQFQWTHFLRYDLWAQMFQKTMNPSVEQALGLLVLKLGVDLPGRIWFHREKLRIVVFDCHLLTEQFYHKISLLIQKRNGHLYHRWSKIHLILLLFVNNKDLTFQWVHILGHIYLA